METLRDSERQREASPEAVAPRLAAGPGRLTGPELVRGLQRSAGNQAVSRMLAGQALLQRSPLSDNLRATWNAADKAPWFDNLRGLTPSARQDSDLLPMMQQLLAGPAHDDDLWLSRQLLAFGPEAEWPLRAGAGADALLDERHRRAAGWGRERGGIRGEIEQSEQGRPVEAFFFPGQTNERALVIAGVHGTEVQGRDVARMLMEDLRNSPAAPFFTVIVVPNLFPDSAAANRRETAINQGTRRQRAIPSNRNFPTATGEAAGTNVDAEGRPIVGENLALIGLMRQFQPTRVISIHGTHRPHLAGIFVDPVAGREQADRDRAIRAAQATAAAVADPDARSAIASRPRGGATGEIQERMDRGELPGRTRAALSAEERARYGETAVVAGNQLFLGAGNENPGWGGEVNQGISLGGYAPPRGMTVYTVEPALNRALDDFPESARGNRMTRDERRVELQAYATAIRTILLGPDPAPATPAAPATGAQGQPAPAAPAEPALARSALAR